MPKGMTRIARAALIALTAGALVALGNPAPSIGRDVSTAVTSAAQLTADLADAARRNLLAPATRLA
ncbi:MAG TPA: hypothetical protein VFT56_13880 [Sphingomonas sp.]|nr:hypothetical protein [Sphingomonas sp.]